MFTSLNVSLTKEQARWLLSFLEQGLEIEEIQFEQDEHWDFINDLRTELYSWQRKA